MADEAEYRAILNYAPVSLAPHDRDEEVSKLQPAKYIGFKRLSEHLAGQVFHGAWLAKGAIIEQGVEFTACFCQYLLHCMLDGLAVIEVQLHGVEPLLLQTYNVCLPAGAGEYPISSVMQPQRNGITYTAGAAGDQNGATLGHKLNPVGCFLQIWVDGHISI